MRNTGSKSTIRTTLTNSYLTTAQGLAKAGNIQAALETNREGLQSEPNNPLLLNQRGTFLHRQGQLDAAHDAYQAALANRPKFPQALNNLGKVLKDLGHFEAAMAAYDHALILRPDYHLAATNKGLLALLMGDFATGWPLYEKRWQAGKKHLRREYTAPQWQGNEEIAGKSILIWSEQGFGDLVQFCRFFPVLIQRGAQIFVEAHTSLRPLLQSLDIPITFLDKAQPPPVATDFHCPLMSLPLALSITTENIPSHSAYLAPPAERLVQWGNRLGDRHTPRIGLAWSGSERHNNDRNRSMPLAALQELLQFPAEFHVVQKDIREGDRQTLRASSLISHDTALTDFADTAALIEALDLVVTVDTSVAHLSAAIGKETWILLPQIPDFRWLLDRDDSPWYDSVSLFRQTEPKGWSAIVDRVAQKLRERFFPSG